MFIISYSYVLETEMYYCEKIRCFGARFTMFLSKIKFIVCSSQLFLR